MSCCILCCRKGGANTNTDGSNSGGWRERSRGWRERWRPGHRTDGGFVGGGDGGHGRHNPGRGHVGVGGGDGGS